MSSIKIAITGGPGSGKTTLLNSLKDLGYLVVPEVAREVSEQTSKPSKIFTS